MIFICWITDFTINTCSQHRIILINNKAFIFDSDALMTVVFLMLNVYLPMMIGSICNPTWHWYGIFGLQLYWNTSLTSLSGGVVTLLLLISPNFNAVSLPHLNWNQSELLDCPLVFYSTVLIPSLVILMVFMHSLKTAIKFSSAKSKSSG